MAETFRPAFTDLGILHKTCFLSCSSLSPFPSCYNLARLLWHFIHEAARTSGPLLMLSLCSEYSLPFVFPWRLRLNIIFPEKPSWSIQARRDSNITCSHDACIFLQNNYLTFNERHHFYNYGFCFCFSYKAVRKVSIVNCYSCSA